MLVARLGQHLEGARGVVGGEAVGDHWGDVQTAVGEPAHDLLAVGARGPAVAAVVFRGVGGDDGAEDADGFHVDLHHVDRGGPTRGAEGDDAAEETGEADGEVEGLGHAGGLVDDVGTAVRGEIKDGRGHVNAIGIEAVGGGADLLGDGEAAVREVNTDDALAARDAQILSEELADKAHPDDDGDFAELGLADAEPLRTVVPSVQKVAASSSTEAGMGMAQSVSRRSG